MTRVLVIDDEDVVRGLMVDILADAGYDVDGAGDMDGALALLERQAVSLVVSDIVMPGCSGLDLLDRIHARRPSLPVVLVTGAGSYENLSQALARGAAGFVTKPFSHAELKAAVREALARAERRERELREQLLTPTLATALANAIEARDPYLHGHCERLAALAVGLALRLGLADGEVEAIRLGAILHDIGKIGIPDRILLKPGPLTDEETAEVRRHPVLGDELLAPLDLLGTSRPIVRHHHERWDGDGYPDGLAGRQIPLGARIVAVADAIEVMSTRTAYSVPLDADGIVDELRTHRGAQWDPQVADLAVSLIERGELDVGSGRVSLVANGRPAAPETAFSVLLVEDDADHARLTAEAIEAAVAGARVRLVADAASAADLCRDSTWSLAVVDHQLPDGSGLDLLDVIRVHAPDLPVVMMTGQGSEAVAVEAFRRGARDYVVKHEGFVDELERRIRDVAVAA